MNHLKDIVSQLEYCGFVCEGGMLKNNTAFRLLKNYANDNYALIKSPCELHRDFVGELCPVCMSNELIRLKAEVERLRAALLSLRIDKHEECEDCWYSCPKSGHCCNEYQDDDICTCGTDRINKIIDDVLKGSE